MIRPASEPTAAVRAPRVVLVSTYDLGRQPFGLASAAAWLGRAGAVVTCNDLAVEPLHEAAIAGADFVAFHLPMHTATRLAARAVPRVRDLNPRARLGFFGLYAPMNEGYLRRLGADLVIGGEFERALAGWVAGGRAAGTELAPPADAPGDESRGRVGRVSRGVAGAGGDASARDAISLERLAFITPDRGGLPDLTRYARVDAGDGRLLTVGYTEASRGCRHLCRHCPIVPVYGGQFRVVPREVVMADIRQQVEAGARHITFGDPDFLNGVGHALPIVRALHHEFPGVTYDITAKVEHLRRHSARLPELRDTGCLFVTSAVESVDDRVLEILDKRHTRADFVEVVRRFRELGLVLHPTFVTFTPWITSQGYLDLLEAIRALDLVENVASVQLAIRLLVPAGSRLLELPEVGALVAAFDESALCHPWAHPDPRVDVLHAEVEAMVRDATARGESRSIVFERAWEIAERALREGGGDSAPAPAAAWRSAVRADARTAPGDEPLAPHVAREPKRPPIPFLTEPWYC